MARYPLRGLHRYCFTRPCLNPGPVDNFTRSTRSTLFSTTELVSVCAGKGAMVAVRRNRVYFPAEGVGAGQQPVPEHHGRDVFRTAGPFSPKGSSRVFSLDIRYPLSLAQ